MSAVGRLVWTYFTATPLMRGLAALGLVCVAVGLTGYSFVPVWTLGTGMRQESLFLQALVLGLPWLGLVLLVCASALMPGIVERLVCGRSIWILPGGRGRLLASVAVPAALLAVLTAAAATIAFFSFRAQISLGHLLTRTLLMAFIDFGLIYTALWLVGKTSGLWRLAGTLWMVVTIMIPFRYLAGIPPFSGLEALGLASWLAFGAMLLAGGRIRHSFQRVRARGATAAKNLVPAIRYAPGGETDLLLGTTRPWVVALGQAVPLGVAAWFVPEGKVWLFFLVLFTAIAGAITSQAAARSRRLWLRFDWSRDEIFGRVERAFWRYNVCSLAVLLLLFVGLGSYFDFTAQVLGLGVALLVLGCAVSAYLGLMITRGLDWFEASLGVVTMVILGLTAVAVFDQNLTAALELEVLLAGLTVAYRVMARTRWTALDWMRCRTA